MMAQALFAGNLSRRRQLLIRLRHDGLSGENFTGTREAFEWADDGESRSDRLQVMSFEPMGFVGEVLVEV